jgi:hypothetical protein
MPTPKIPGKINNILREYPGIDFNKETFHPPPGREICQLD